MTRYSMSLLKNNANRGKNVAWGNSLLLISLLHRWKSPSDPTAPPRRTAVERPPEQVRTRKIRSKSKYDNQKNRDFDSFASKDQRGFDHKATYYLIEPCSTPASADLGEGLQRQIRLFSPKNSCVSVKPFLLVQIFIRDKLHKTYKPSRVLPEGRQLDHQLLMVDWWSYDHHDDSLLRSSSLCCVRLSGLQPYLYLD